MPFRTVAYEDLKHKVERLYNKAHESGLDEDEFRTLQAMENELNRRGFELVEKVIIQRSNPRLCSRATGFRKRS